MRIKTMNTKINVGKQDISYVLGEFRLKLERYLMADNIDAVTHVSCYKVKIQSRKYLPDKYLDEIQEIFMLELDEYVVTYAADGTITDVWYYFNHTKPS